MTFRISAVIRDDIITPAYLQAQNPNYYKSLGDSLMDKKKYEYAISSYKKSMEMSPEKNEILLNIARAYLGLQDYNDTIKSLNKYVSAAASTCEAETMLGETYLEEGNYEEALKSFQKAMEADDKDDNAKRGYLETQNKILEQTDPERAKREKYEHGVKTLNEALGIVTQYLSPEYMKSLSSLKVMFDKTASMSGTANIAQYEHGKKRIVITDKYTYAAPEIISAYLVHEFVHAKDNDAFTSVAEEQDAYRAASQFWLLNSNGIKDSEMDYAAELYQKSPETLDHRVSEIYQLRDPDIAMTSPNHKGSFVGAASSGLKSVAADTSLKKYDYIA